MVYSYDRGHKIYLRNSGFWHYVDNDKIMDAMRPCKKCKKKPTKEGYDACIGHIDGADSACCGHGIEDAYVINKNIGEKDETRKSNEVTT
jgi:hypothetical protein